jgi:hypothetical protein
MQTSRIIFGLIALAVIAGCASPQFTFDRHSEELEDIAVKMESLEISPKEKNTVDGANIYIKNQAAETVVIEWARSSIAIGTYSTIPFLGGMKYMRAGDPEKLPETPIPPGGVRARKVYFSRMEGEGEDDDDYEIVGAKFREGEPQVFALTLAVRKGNNPIRYFTFKKKITLKK